MILNKAGFDSKISHFFSRYLINRQTQYVWNYFISPFFRASVSVGQRSALSSALYIATIFHIFEKRAKNLFIYFSFVSFIFIILFLFFSTNSVWLSNMTNWKFFISLDQQRMLILLH